MTIFEHRFDEAYLIGGTGAMTYNPLAIMGLAVRDKITNDVGTITQMRFVIHEPVMVLVEFFRGSTTGFANNRPIPPRWIPITRLEVIGSSPVKGVCRFYELCMPIDTSVEQQEKNNADF